jgi:hypothetical protein
MTIFSFTDLTVLECTAGEAGGIYVDYECMVDLSVDNFTGCSAGNAGAALWVWDIHCLWIGSFLTLVGLSEYSGIEAGCYPLPALKHCNFCHSCSLSRAVLYGKGYGMIVVNCVFLNNSVDIAMSMTMVNESKKFQVSYSLFSGPLPNNSWCTFGDGSVANTSTASFAIAHLNTCYYPTETPSLSPLGTSSDILFASHLLVPTSGNPTRREDGLTPIYGVLWTSVPDPSSLWSVSAGFGVTDCAFSGSVAINQSPTLLAATLCPLILNLSPVFQSTDSANLPSLLYASGDFIGSRPSLASLSIVSLLGDSSSKPISDHLFQTDMTVSDYLEVPSKFGPSVRFPATISIEDSICHSRESSAPTSGCLFQTDATVSDHLRVRSVSSRSAEFRATSPIDNSVCLPRESSILISGSLFQTDVTVSDYLGVLSVLPRSAQFPAKSPTASSVCNWADSSNHMAATRLRPILKHSGGFRLSSLSEFSDHFAPSGSQWTLPITGSTDFVPVALWESDLMVPWTFLADLSASPASDSGGFTMIAMSGIGVGLLVILALILMAAVRVCRSRRVPVAPVSRSLEYSENESEHSSDAPVLGFRPEVGKTVGKSMWVEDDTDESDSDSPSI